MKQTIVYKLGGKNRGPKGLTWSYKGVGTADELSDAMHDGWTDDLHKLFAKGKNEQKKLSNEEDVQEDDGEKVNIEEEEPEKVLRRRGRPRKVEVEVEAEENAVD